MKDKETQEQQLEFMFVADPEHHSSAALVLRPRAKFRGLPIEQELELILEREDDHEHNA